VVLLADLAGPEEVRAVGSTGAVVTARGGLFSEAAGCARVAGTVMVAGVRPMVLRRGIAQVGEHSCAEGDWLTVDGERGTISLGEPRLSRAAVPRILRELLAWSDTLRAPSGPEIRANTDDAAETSRARRLGARGVGLCRTERMLSRADRRPLLGRYLRCRSQAERPALARALKNAYRSELRAILVAARGEPVTIRLLDPSLGELLGVAGEPEPVSGSWADPRVGLRGCRVGMVWPEIYEIQAVALFEAACALQGRGIVSRPEILIPQVSAVGELVEIRDRLAAAIRSTCRRLGQDIPYRVGAMIEVPRAAVLAGALAPHADFLCFGTNDLTAAVYGLDRSASAGLVQHQVKHGYWPDDPFRVLDGAGVGELMRLAAQAARAACPGIVLGVCGEHAGEPRSIRRMLGSGLGLGLGYLSCSPQRIPVARLAAAQAVVGLDRLEEEPECLDAQRRHQGDQEPRGGHATGDRG
jgi:pyruvate,orthophosphate dikinase